MVNSKKSSTFAPAFEKRAIYVVSLAQLVEQLTLNQWVESSSLSGDTKKVHSAPFFVPRPQTLGEFLSRFARTIIAETQFSSPSGDTRKDIRWVSFSFIAASRRRPLPLLSGQFCRRPSSGSRTGRRPAKALLS